MTSLLTFLFAITLLTMTPGFDTALILRTSAASGWKKALATSMGIMYDVGHCGGRGAWRTASGIGSGL